MTVPLGHVGHRDIKPEGNRVVSSSLDHHAANVYNSSECTSWAVTLYLYGFGLRIEQTIDELHTDHHNQAFDGNFCILIGKTISQVIHFLNKGWENNTRIEISVSYLTCHPAMMFIIPVDFINT